MKKILYISILSVLMFSCGGDGGDSPVVEPPIFENEAPSIPQQMTPANNLLCIDNAVIFEWSSAVDPEGDAVTYELQIATNSEISENVITRVSIESKITVSLEKGVAYYWRVRAKDSNNAASAYSSVFSFYTEGDGESNHLPFSPVLVAPEINSIVQEASVSLQWTASDVDNDPLKFDVYVDVSNPPTLKVAEGISELSYTQVVESSRDYFWRIVVKDDKGGEAIGQVWSFKKD